MKQSLNQVDIAIVGGGAAGLAAAVAAGKELRGHDGRVVLCEANDRVGRSILATGNGRCNFSNARLTEAVCRNATALEAFYRNAPFVAEALAALEGLSLFINNTAEQASLDSECSNAVLRFFADQGLMWREEGEGRLYPLANKASSVLDVLRAAVRTARVDALTEFRLRTILKGSDGFLLEADDGREVLAQCVVLATGGAIDQALADSAELPFVSQRPVLGPLAVQQNDRRLAKRLDNIRVKARATLLREDEALGSEQGEVLFRAYGLSGIAVFDLSREAQAGDVVSLDLLPQLAPERTEELLRSRAQRSSEWGEQQPTYEDLLRGMVLPQVAAALAERARVKLDAGADARGCERLAHTLHDLRFVVEGIGDVRQCQVKRGGVSVAAIDAATLEARAKPGLYVAGEALDVDAACGGFNLHWAWASGMLAGHKAAHAISRRLEEVR